MSHSTLLTLPQQQLILLVVVFSEKSEPDDSDDNSGATARRHVVPRQTHGGTDAGRHDAGMVALFIQSAFIHIPDKDADLTAELDMDVAHSELKTTPRDLISIKRATF